MIPSLLSGPRSRGLAVAGLLAVRLWTPAGAHEVLHEIRQAEAVVIELRYADGSPFSQESFEIYRPGEDVPYFSGFTDATGCIAFRPDIGGEWRARVVSADGHGADWRFEVNGNLAVAQGAARPWTRSLRLLSGIAVIFVIFLFLGLVTRRRSR